MRVASCVMVGLLVSGCTGSAPAVETVVPSIVAQSAGGEDGTTTTRAETTTTAESCGSIPYDIAVFPDRVQPSAVPTDDVARDDFTSVPGTVLQLWVDSEGELALAFVRGALPPREWPGDRGEVSIDGARGVAGPFDDGSWVIAWFEAEGEPCDQFYMVFYPPVEPEEVEQTIHSLNRRAG